MKTQLFPMLVNIDANTLSSLSLSVHVVVMVVSGSVVIMMVVCAIMCHH